MKKSIAFITCMIVITLFGPIILIGASKSKNHEVKSVSSSKINVKAGEKKEDVIFRIKLNNSEIKNIKAKDYLIGCVAAEMPINYEEEALKAQTVAAYTYALRKKLNSSGEYDITDDYRVDQCYISEEEMKKRWGENYEQQRGKLEKIIDSVEGEWVCYKNEPALTVYHAISCGKTYDAKEVWGEDIKYLKSVDSSFDKTDKNYKTTQKFTSGEFLKLLELDKKITTVKINDCVKESSGRVKSIDISGEKINGVTAMKKLNLRSSNYSVKTENDMIVFTVLGYGHGVGMSQVGANAMAKNGSTYKEILHHYYRRCSIKKN